MALLRGPEGTHKPYSPHLHSPGSPPALPTAQGPVSAPQCCLSLPQLHHSTASQPWALPHQARTQAHIPPWPRPSPMPREMTNAQGWGCPQPACCLAGAWDGPWLPGPALPQGPLVAPAPRESPAAAMAVLCIGRFWVCILTLPAVGT